MLMIPFQLSFFVDNAEHYNNTAVAGEHSSTVRSILRGHRRV